MDQSPAGEHPGNHAVLVSGYEPEAGARQDIHHPKLYRHIVGRHGHAGRRCLSGRLNTSAGSCRFYRNSRGFGVLQGLSSEVKGNLDPSAVSAVIRTVHPHVTLRETFAIVNANAYTQSRSQQPGRAAYDDVLRGLETTLDELVTIVDSCFSLLKQPFFPLTPCYLLHTF